MSDLIGRTLGPYTILGELGHGGMANVYRAVQPSIEREVAIKVLPAHFLQDRTFLERFTREAKVIAKLQHPHILPIYDFGEHQGLPYIVMAYMPGGTLSERVHRSGGGLPLDDAARLIEQIAAGLDYAHQKGIIHRDFKPSNVLLDDNGNVYLADFGIAKVTEATAQLTGSGIVGTPAYMAPEMATPEGLSHLVDIYALGVTLFEMLSGRQPYQAPTPMGVLMAHGTQPIPDIHKYRPELPPETQNVIDRAMAKNPDQRYQKASDLSADLSAIASYAAGIPGGTMPLAPAPPDAQTMDVADLGAGISAPPLSQPQLRQTPTPRGYVTPEQQPQPQRGTTTEPFPTGMRPATQPLEAGSRRKAPWGWIVGAGAVVLVVGLCGLLVAGAFSLLGGQPGLAGLPFLGAPTKPPSSVPTLAGGQAGPATAAPTSVPSDIDTSRDTLVICMAQEPDTLYGMVSAMWERAQVGYAFEGRGWIYDRAYFYETQMLVNDEFPTLENGGATLTNNVLSVTFRFKDNITWSDGVPFTVDDIIFTRDVILDPDSGVPDRGILDQMIFEKVDDHTLKVTYPQDVKDPLYFLPPLAGPNAFSAPLPQHVLGNMDPADIPTSDYARLPTPVLGPYEPVQWVEGDHITLRAVEDWWGGEIMIPNLIYRFVTNSDQLLASVLSGECDYATSDGLAISQLPLLQQSANRGTLKYDAVPNSVWEHIDFNTWPVEPDTESNGIPFFADLRARQAIAYGTDRQQMADEIMYGETQLAFTFLPSDHWAWNPDTEGAYPYDPEKARTLLAEAGWQDTDGDGILEAASTLRGDYGCDRGSWVIPAGSEFEVTFWISQAPSLRGQIATLFQSYMADIGIKINISTVPGVPALFAEGGPMWHRTFQIGEFAWVATDMGMYSVYGEDQIPTASNGYNGEYQNILGWCNHAASQAFQNADDTLLREGRLSHLLEAQRLFTEEIPSLPLFERVDIEAYNPRLCGPSRGPLNYASWNVEAWYFSLSGNCGG